MAAPEGAAIVICGYQQQLDPPQQDAPSASISVFSRFSVGTGVSSCAGAGVSGVEEVIEDMLNLSAGRGPDCRN